MVRPGVACLIPLMHGWHHHVRGMELTKHSNQRFGLAPHPYIVHLLYQESGSHLFRGLRSYLQQNCVCHLKAYLPVQFLRCLLLLHLEMSTASSPPYHLLLCGKVFQ